MPPDGGRGAAPGSRRCSSTSDAISRSAIRQRRSGRNCERSQARTRRVHENPVKWRRPRCGSGVGHLTRTLASAEPRTRLERRSARLRRARRRRSPPRRHQLRQVRPLASRRGAQVQDPLAGLAAQHGARRASPRGTGRCSARRATAARHARPRGLRAPAPPGSAGRPVRRNPGSRAPSASLTSVFARKASSPGSLSAGHQGRWPARGPRASQQSSRSTADGSA